MVKAQEYIDNQYHKEIRKFRQYLYLNDYDFEMKKVKDNYDKLEGDLDLSDFVNLEYLDIEGNKITSLNLKNCCNIKSINACRNLLENLDFLKSLNRKKLNRLSITSNNICENGLWVFKNFINLDELRIGNYIKDNVEKEIYNRFRGSLQPLQNLTCLRTLDISGTDIDQGVEFLPISLEYVKHSSEYRPNSRVEKINFALNEFQYQNEKNKVVRSAEFIPFNYFTNIEYIAQGGYGTIYKADLKNETYALKVFNKSKITNEKFYHEVHNYRLFDQYVGMITKCHGISKDHENNNVIVLSYAKEGDLRCYLGNNWKTLTFQEKINNLKLIAIELSMIHYSSVIHGDFHPGNILKNGDLFPISDLGASDLIKQKSNLILGVLPYVSPEILRGDVYRQSSDIYSFAIIAYEVLTGILPYYNEDWSAFDFKLRIIKGYRPDWKLSPLKFPQLLIDLIESCWDNEFEKRPNCKEVSNKIISWLKNTKDVVGNEYIIEDTEFYKQYLDCEEYNKNVQTRPTNSFDYHNSICIHSKEINTKELMQQLQTQSLGNNQTNKMDEIKEKLSEMITDFNQEIKFLINQFIKISIQLNKAETDNLIEQIEEVEEKLKNWNVKKKIISKIEDYCKELNRLDENNEFQFSLETQL